MSIDGLELKAGFTSRIGECFDFSVVEVSTTIEYDLFDVGFLGAGCDEFTDFLGRGLVRCSFFDSFVETRSGTECVTRYVIDDLGVDMLVCISDSKTGASSSSGHLFTDAAVNALADLFAIESAHFSKVVSN